jgi:hypothetical protein
MIAILYTRGGFELILDATAIVALDVRLRIREAAEMPELEI